MRVYFYVVFFVAMIAVPSVSAAVLNLAGGARFAVESALLGSDGEAGARSAGWMLRAWLNVRVVWEHAPDQYLLQFNLESPKLHLRRKHVNAEWLPRASVWDSHLDRPFYALLHAGSVRQVYLEADELVDFTNYKKSLISLFQFQAVDGAYNETDISGQCVVHYEQPSELVVRKIKRSCTWSGQLSHGVPREEDGGWERALPVRRLVRLERGAPGDVRALWAEDVALVEHSGLAVKVRSWHHLQAREPAPPAAATPGQLSQAVPPHLAPAALPLVEPQPRRLSPAHRNLSALMEEVRRLPGDGDGDGNAGDELDDLEMVAIVPELIRALRSASARELAAIFEERRNERILELVWQCAGLAGTAAAHAATRPLLAAARASLYLRALALAPRVQEAVVADVLVLARGGPAEDALLVGEARAALGALGGRLPAHRAAARTLLTEALADCGDEQCAERCLVGLANLRDPGTVPLLLRLAEGGVGGAGGAAGALSALGEVAAAAPLALRPDHLRRLTRLVLQLQAPAPLEVRAAALDTLLVAAAGQARALGLSALPVPLEELAEALGGRGWCAGGDGGELARLMWQRLAALAERLPAVSHHVRLVRRLRRHPADYCQRGMSMYLERGVWSGAEWAARLGSSQSTRGGLLRAARLELWAEEQTGAARLPLAGVSLWARGLHSLTDQFSADAEEDAADAEEEVSAGLALSAGGTWLPGQRLFAGTGELAAAAWRADGSPRPVLSAYLSGETADRVPSAVGALVERAMDGTLHVMWDADIQVSLWSRTLRGGVSLRARGAAVAQQRSRTAWSELAVRTTYRAAPAAQVRADLDFYEKVTLCVKATTDNFYVTRNVTVEEGVAGVTRLTLRSTRRGAGRGGARSMHLGADNDRACAVLTAH